MAILKNLGDFENLPLNTKLHRPTYNGPENYFFYGIQPRSKDSIMLGSSLSVNKVECQYIGKDKELKYPLYTDYKEACIESYELSKKRAQTIKEIFVDGK